jgi:hypothetical protein
MWQDVADFVIPNANDITTTVWPGSRRTDKVFDSTAIQSAELLAAALHGMLTNPAVMWFGLTSGDDQLDELDNVRLWLQNTARQMHNVLNATNFQTEIHEVYQNIVSLGTAAMDIIEDPRDIVVFESRHIKEVYIAENHLGFIDEVYRCYKQNAKQLVQEFGEESLPKKVLDAFNKNSPEKFECLHAVYPSNLAKERSKTSLQFVSQYILLDGKKELSEKGFYEMPYTVPRWSKSSGETYGRSPGMNALPDIKMINAMEKTMIMAAQKLADPPLQMPDEGVVLPIDVTPGGLNYVRQGSGNEIKPIFNNAQPEFGYQIQEATRQRIRSAFFIDQLQLSSGPQMTATEVSQRTEEKMRLMGPVMGRFNGELLSPLVGRLYGIMSRRGMIAQPPKELQKSGFQPVFTSLIAKAQKAGETQAISRMLELSVPLIQLNPSVADNLNGDSALRVIAKINGVDQRVLRDEEDVKRMRSQRAQAQQAQMQQQQQSIDAQNVAKMAPLAKVANTGQTQ